jgi:hypothetical protein
VSIDVQAAQWTRVEESHLRDAIECNKIGDNVDWVRVAK